MRHVLEGSDEHWEIVESANGEEAVAKAQELRPKLIIVDLVMPLMDAAHAKTRSGRAGSSPFAVAQLHFPASATPPNLSSQHVY